MRIRLEKRHPVKQSIALLLLTSSFLLFAACATHDVKRKSKALQERITGPEEEMIRKEAAKKEGEEERKRRETGEEERGKDEMEKGAGGKENQGLFHIVKKGENLYRIAKTYGVEMSELAEINSIEDPAKIYEGQPIFIPGAEKKIEVQILEKKGRLAYNGEKFTWPVSGAIGSHFGVKRRGHYHSGIDILAPYGTEVVASRNGFVVFSGFERGYGRMIIVDHQDGTSTVYAHNSANLVKEGDRISQGDVIAHVGRSGNATGPHLHFEIRIENDSINPCDYLE